MVGMVGIRSQSCSVTTMDNSNSVGTRLGGFIIRTHNNMRKIHHTIIAEQKTSTH